MMRKSQALEADALDPMTTHPVMIRKIIWENDDTFTLTLDMSGFAGGFHFLPGQFNMVYVYGIGEAAVSISSDPARPGTLDHTIHRVGLVTTSLAQKKRGDMIGIRGPFGSSWPIDVARGKDICIASGGIGLAPLRPVIYSLLKRREDYGRIIVLYGGRSPLDLLYRVELEKWASDANVEVLVTVDRGDSSWKGHIGVVTSLFQYIKLDARETVTYVCGPEIMMKYTIDELDRRGVPQSQTYLSMERNMKCAVGFCGHCQFGPTFICKEGPVYPLPRVRHLLDRKEL
ncbi:MAG: Ni/Fe hydrogenase subunit gamma [Bacteroidetes bacterium]|nr:Ni/Fe hydrogenase subunit gamma [Bacteroidota bacterium]